MIIYYAKYWLFIVRMISSTQTLPYIIKSESLENTLLKLPHCLIYILPVKGILYKIWKVEERIAIILPQ